MTYFDPSIGHQVQLEVEERLAQSAAFLGSAL